MNVKKGEAETAIRALCYQWAAECGIRPDPNGDPREFHPSFTAFTRWMQEKGYGQYLRFRSTMVQRTTRSCGSIKSSSRLGGGKPLSRTEWVPLRIAMEKLKLNTPDLTKANVERLAGLFPQCVTEAADEDGKLVRSIDFDLLRQELSDRIVDGPAERYRLDWPGKREALLAANAPIAKTLRPVREESVDFDTTRNLFIEGNNLDALKLLLEAYLGRIKIVYIDPPYNRKKGNNLVYRDDFVGNTFDYLLASN